MYCGTGKNSPRGKMGVYFFGLRVPWGKMGVYFFGLRVPRNGGSLARCLAEFVSCGAEAVIGMAGSEVENSQKDS